MVQTTNQKKYIVVNPVINLDWETAWGWSLSGFATSKITMKQHQCATKNSLITVI